MEKIPYHQRFFLQKASKRDILLTKNKLIQKQCLKEKKFELRKPSIFTFNIIYLFYRHDKPTDPDDPLADQNIKDRFYGVNDPVADKLMRRYNDMPKLTSPEDKTITTLYIGNLGEKVDEQELK